MIKTVIAALAVTMASAAMPAAAAPPDGKGADRARVYVAYHAGQRGAAQKALAAVGAEVHHDFPALNAYAVSVPTVAVQALARSPGVEYVEEDPKRYPLAQTTPYGIPMVQADQLTVPAGGNVLACIIDSGYDAGHEDLPSATGTPTSGSGIWNRDGLQHGTHVAGTVAALNNGAGVVGVTEGAGGVALYIVRVFGDTGSWIYSSGLVGALNACESVQGNRNLVVNMSLGGGVKSRTEDRAFAQADSRGVLSIAAAGNDGNTRNSYPASYNSVVSVAAVDSNGVVADFSQQNSQVELAGPGVLVLSTVPMGTGTEQSVSVSGAGYEAIAMEGSPNATAGGSLVDCGRGTSACPGAGGKVCLIERGDITFAEKVLACQAGGGVAAVIYNNASGLFSGTLGGEATTIPSVGISGEDGATLSAAAGQSATVTVEAGNYAYFDGTSMATPHVAGVAALVWSNNTGASNADVRAALGTTALDLGAAGRDAAYGFGLVQAKAASDYLAGGGGGGGGGGGDPGGGGGGSCDLGQIGDSCTSDSQCCSGSCKGKPGAKTCK